MARLILATLAGILAMGLTVMTVEGIGHTLYPPPPGADLSDPAQLAALMQVIPWQAKATVLVGWALGALAGPAVAARLARPRGRIPALVVGLAMLLASAATMWMIPHPWWMVAFGLLAPLPLAWLAGHWAGRG